MSNSHFDSPGIVKKGEYVIPHRKKESLTLRGSGRQAVENRSQVREAAVYLKETPGEFLHWAYVVGYDLNDCAVYLRSETDRN